MLVTASTYHAERMPGSVLSASHSSTPLILTGTVTIGHIITPTSEMRRLRYSETGSLSEAARLGCGRDVIRTQVFCLQNPVPNPQTVFTYLLSLLVFGDTGIHGNDSCNTPPSYFTTSDLQPASCPSASLPCPTLSLGKHRLLARHPHNCIAFRGARAPVT